MKFFVISIGFLFYLVIIYTLNLYYYDSFDVLNNEDELLRYKGGAKYFPGAKRSEKKSQTLNFEKFYKIAVERLIPKLTLEEQMELKKWSHEKQIIKRTKKCDKYFKIFPPIIVDDTISKFEEKSLESFNLAFIHHIQKDIAIYESFLSIYFRPNNFYCIHLDKKAEDEVREALQRLVQCYSSKIRNGKIFLLNLSESYEITWAGDLLVQADMKCLELLLRHNQSQKKEERKWRYVSIMSGDELPLVSYSKYHKELASKLKDELSAVESVPVPNMQILSRLTLAQRGDCANCPNAVKHNAFNMSWKSLVAKENLQFSIFNDNAFSEMSPDIQIYKGVRNVILSSKDSDFIANDEVSKKFRKWQIGSQFTEEHFYSTIIRIKHDKKEGTIFQDRKRSPESYLHKICPRYTPWYFGPRLGTKNQKRKACFGNIVMGVCAFSTLDLSELQQSSSPCLAATKFSLETDSTAVLFHLTNLMGKSFLETQVSTKKVAEYQQGPEQRFVNRFDKSIKQLLFQVMA